MLATINTVDFLYTCPGHLADHNFASRIADESAPAKSAVSPEEIAKIKQEWEENQKKKQEKEKDAKEKDKEKGKDDTDKKDKKKEGETSTDGSKSPQALSETATPPKVAPVHEKYALHRDYYAS